MTGGAEASERSGWQRQYELSGAAPITSFELSPIATDLISNDVPLTHAAARSVTHFTSFTHTLTQRVTELDITPIKIEQKASLPLYL